MGRRVEVGLHEPRGSKAYRIVGEQQDHCDLMVHKSVTHGHINPVSAFAIPLLTSPLTRPSAVTQSAN